MRPIFKATAILHRNDPIFRGCLLGKPTTEDHTLYDIAYSASALEMFDTHGPQGVTAVHCPPEGDSISSMVIAMKPHFIGHSRNVGRTLISSSVGKYIKYVVVVDDDIELLQIMRDFIEEDTRFELRTAATGFDAGVATQEFKPDLIFLDIMLPDINGMEVCRYVKNTEPFSNTKIIVISGMIERDKIDELYQMGIDHYFQKPFNLTEIKKKACEVLDMD